MSDKTLKPAQLMAQRFRMSNENQEVKQTMGQKRREMKEQHKKRELLASKCRRTNYKY